MNKKVKNILICIIVILGILVLSIGLFLIFKPTPTNKELLVNALNEKLDGLTSSNENGLGIYDFPKKFYNEDAIIKLDSEVSFDVDTNGTLENAKLKGESYSSLDKFYLTILAEKDSIETFSLDALFKDNILYHKINNKYSNFYHTEFDIKEFEDKLSSVNVDDINFESIVDEIAQVLLDEIKDDKVTKTEKEVTLGDKDYTLDKVTVKFTEKDVYEILKNVVKNLKDNNEFKKLLDSNEELKNLNLDDLISELESMISDADNKKNLLSFSIYLDGDDILSYEFAISVNSDEADVTIKFVVNDYKVDGKENIETYISIMGMKMLGFEFHEINDKKADFKFYIMNTMDIKGNIQYNDKSVSIKATGTVEEELESGNTKEHEFVDFNMKFENVSDDEVNIDFDVELELEENKVSINSENICTLVDEFPNVDVSDSKPIENMSPKDKKTYEEFFGGFSLNSNVQFD